MSLTALIYTYGYLIVFIGSLFEGETILILAGLAVHEGLLSLPFVLLWAFVGALIGDSGWFFLGRYKGESVLQRFSWLRRAAERPQTIIKRRPKLISFLVRFLYGFRHIVPFSLGMSRVPFSIFIIYNSFGALVWVIAIGTAGYLFGDLLETILGDIRRYEFRIIIIAIAGIAILNSIARIVRFVLRRHVQ